MEECQVGVSLCFILWSFGVDVIMGEHVRKLNENTTGNNENNGHYHFPLHFSLHSQC